MHTCTPKYTPKYTLPSGFGPGEIPALRNILFPLPLGEGKMNDVHPGVNSPG